MMHVARWHRFLVLIFIGSRTAGARRAATVGTAVRELREAWKPRRILSEGLAVATIAVTLLGSRSA